MYCIEESTCNIAGCFRRQGYCAPLVTPLADTSAKFMRFDRPLIYLEIFSNDFFSDYDVRNNNCDIQES